MAQQVAPKRDLQAERTANSQRYERLSVEVEPLVKRSGGARVRFGVCVTPVGRSAGGQSSRLRRHLRLRLATRVRAAQHVSLKRAAGCRAEHIANA